MRYPLAETKARFEYSKRQFDIFKLRASQAQAEASLCILQGDAEGAKRKLENAKNFLMFADEIGDTIDSFFRELNPEESPMAAVDTNPRHRGI